MGVGRERPELRGRAGCGRDGMNAGGTETTGANEGIKGLANDACAGGMAARTRLSAMV